MTVERNELFLEKAESPLKGVLLFVSCIEYGQLIFKLRVKVILDEVPTER